MPPAIIMIIFAMYVPFISPKPILEALSFLVFLPNHAQTANNAAFNAKTTKTINIIINLLIRTLSFTINNHEMFYFAISAAHVPQAFNLTTYRELSFPTYRTNNPSIYYFCFLLHFSPFFSGAFTFATRPLFWLSCLFLYFF